jgi:hypothetical protein
MLAYAGVCWRMQASGVQDSGAQFLFYYFFITFLFLF